jgi:hypothetical protein
MIDLLLKHKLFFSFSFLVAISILLIIFRIISGSFSPPVNTVNEGEISPLEQVVINKTTQQEVENLDTVEDKKTLPDGAVRYSLISPLVTRKNEVLVKDNRVVFERILIPESKNALGYATISDYTKRHGQPEETIEGSRFYGPPISTFIYANQGFAFIANTITDEVYEIQKFQPMSVSDYKSLYGQDIEEGVKSQL